MDPLDLPIVCTLTEAELRERRRTVLDSISESAIEAIESEDGYTFHFRPTSGVLSRLSNLVPTWVINRERIEQVLTLQELGDKSGFKAPPPKAN